MFHANLSRKNWSGNTNIRTSIVFKKNCYRGECEDVGIGGKKTPMKISKIHLHVEQFSLKSNWRLAERLLHNPGCKMIHRKSVGREENPSDLPVNLEGDIEEKGDYRVEILIR